MFSCTHIHIHIHYKGWCFVLALWMKTKEGKQAEGNAINGKVNAASLVFIFTQLSASEMLRFKRMQQNETDLNLLFCY